MDIKTFRSSYPEFNDYSDDEIVSTLQETEFPDYSKQEVAEEMGVHSSTFIDYSTNPEKEKLKRADVASPTFTSKDPDTKLIDNLNSRFTSPEFLIAGVDEKEKIIDTFFAENLADRYPPAYRDQFHKQFKDTIRAGVNAGVVAKQRAMEQKFNDIENNRVHGTFWKRKGQAALQAFDWLLEANKTLERKLGIVPEGYYEEQRSEKNWESFADKYIRQKQYESTGLFDEVTDTIVQSAVVAVPMVAGMLAASPAGGAWAMAAAFETKAAVALTSVPTYLASAAMEAGSKRQELDQDPRFEHLSSDEKDEMSLFYGAVSGAIETASSMIGGYLLAKTGGAFIRAFQKTGAGASAVKQGSKLINRLATFKNTKFGKYMELVYAPIAAGTVELTEETFQTITSDAIDMWYLNPILDPIDVAKKLWEYENTPERKKELLHVAKVAALAGGTPTGVVNTARASVKIKADLFSKEDPIDLKIDAAKALSKLDEIIEVAKREGASPEEIGELVKHRETIRKTEEAVAAGETIDPQSIEEEVEIESERYKELLKTEREEAETIDRREHPVDPGGAEYTEAERRKKLRDDIPDRRKDIDTAKDVWRKYTVKDISAMSKEDAETLVKNYETIPEENRNKFDAARYRQAQAQVRTLAASEAESKALNEAVAKKINDTPLQDTQGSVTPVVTPQATIDPRTDLRSPRFKKTALQSPSGQKPTPKSKLNGGLIFTRKGKYRNSHSIPIDINKVDDSGEPIWSDVNRAILDNVEGKIVRGEWKFQELFDRVVSLSPDISFELDPTIKARGRLRTQYDNNKNVKRHIIQINPSAIDQMHGDDVSGLEVTLIHELVHTLHNTATGIASGEKAQAYYKEISNLWDQVDPDFLEQIEYWADEYEYHADPELRDRWFNYTDEQRAKREAWYIVRDAIEAARDGNAILWDELPAMFLSDPNLQRDLFNVPSVNSPDVKDSIGARLLKIMLSFINSVLGKGKVTPSLMDDIVDIHARLMDSLELNKQSYANVPVTEEHRNSLYIEGNTKFPKNAKYLNPAFKLSDTVIHNPIGHWYMLDQLGDVKDGVMVDGFAAVDTNGKVIKFYSRQEAAELVDPTGKVVVGGTMLSEDIPEIALSQDSKVIRKRDGKLNVVGTTDVQVKRRRRLSEADKALLAARKAARGGKTLSEVWAEKRSASDREIKQVKYVQKEKKGIPGDRWALERATDGLVSMKDTTIERELMRTLDAIREMLQKGTSERSPRLMYYKRRRDAIELIQEKRLMDKVKAQKLKQNTLRQKAGKTANANLRFYKAEYKRAIRLDAPVSQVNFVKGQLLDLMGDNFWEWSGEAMPVIKAKAQQPEVKKVIEEKPITPAAKPTTPTVKVIEPFTEEDQRKREQGTDEETATVAKSAEDAAATYYAVMGHLRDNYIAKGKPVPLTYVDKITKQIVQAHTYKVINDQEKAEAIDELASAMEGMEDSFESRSVGKLDLTQAQMNKMMPVKVKFDAYHAKHEGYVPHGYMFTITDPSHPANKSTFAIQELTQKAIDEKFADIDSMYSRYSTDQEMRWSPLENSTRATVEESAPDADGEYIRIFIDHFRRPVTFFTKAGKAINLPDNWPSSNVAWSFVDKHGNESYERKFTYDDEGNKVTAISKPFMFFGVINRIRTLLREITRGEHKAPAPAYITFSSTVGDNAKTIFYEKLANTIKKTLAWDMEVDEQGFHIYNPDFKLTAAEELLYDSEDFDVSTEAGPEFRDISVAQAGLSIKDDINRIIPDFENRGGANNKTAMFTIGDSVVYKHSDGGTYYDLAITYDAENRHVAVFGRHVHYDEVVELANELLPNTKVAWDEAREYLIQKLTSGLIEDDTRSQPVFEPVDVEALEDSLSSREGIDAGDLLNDVFDSPAPRHTMQDPNMEDDAKRYEKGITKESLLDRGKKWIEHIRRLAREFEPLKRKEYGDIQFLLRQLKKGKEQAAEKAVEHLTKILGELSSNQYHNLQRLAYLMDLREQVIVNETKIANGEDPDTIVAMPFGWNPDQVKTEAARIWNIVRADAQTYQAWRDRQDTWFRIREAYKDATDKVGFDATSRLNRVYYFRHQVLELLEAEKRFYGISGSNKLAVPTQRSYLRKRGAKNKHAINLNYVQAEFEVMAQMMYDTQISNTLADIMERHGSKEQLPGYVMYRPREESIFYMTNTIPGKLVAEAMAKGATQINVPKDKIKKAMAMGGKYQGYYLPAEIAETLNNALVERPYGEIMRGLRKALTAWKMWQLLNPVRALKYNVRNLTGDAEAVFIGSPEVFKWIPEAVRDLYNWKKSGNLPSELKAWLDRGGMQSTLQSMEIIKIVEAPEFRKQLGKSKLKANPIAWGKTWFKYARAGSDLREAMLRYAAFKKFKNEIANNNGKPKRYIASLPEEVDVLNDINDKAFLMSNDLLGAYDRISTGGENLRKFWVPFWSFQEVNVKRSIAMWRNAINDDTAVSQVGRRLGAKTPVIALKLGALAIKFMLFSAAIQAWNEWMWPEAESALPEEMRQRSHIILWSPEDNNPKNQKIVYFPRIGVVGDLLEWVGFESAPSDARDIYQIATGQKTWDQKTKEMHKVFEKYEYGKENVERIINKLAQSVGPQYKMPLELLMGEKFFPSVFNRQPITDTGKWFFDQFSMGAVYDKVSGRPQRKGSFSTAALKTVAYAEDKNRLGWLATQQRLVEYQKKHGLKGKGFIVTESGTALYNLGLAWRYGDEQAVNKYFTEYVLLSIDKLSTGVNFNQTLRGQWEKLNPLNALPKKHQQLFYASLDERGIKQFNLALEYYAEMAGGVQFIKDR